MSIQSGNLKEFAIEEIDIGRRQRRDMGDIHRLAASIEEVGLLQPIVITPRGQLIAGQRRLEAHRLLKRTTILCCIVDDLKNATVLLQAEIMENTCRQPFSPSEAVSAAEALLPLAADAAKDRKFHRADEEASEKFSEAGEAMNQIAKLLGLSRPTLEKATKVVAAARQDNERYGDLVQKMDRTGKVNGAYMQMLQRQGEAPGRAAPAYLSIRMDRSGNCKITGLQDKREIIANLKALIRQIEDQLSESS
jgi:ParB-like chromosome segregation protein Spo0J